ncbi:MAG: tetratricopeptide repeat protein [Nitrospirota bacterium]
MAEIQNTPSTTIRLFGNPYLAFIVIALVSIAAYSNSFNVPFHFDDRNNIVENPFIKNLSPSNIENFPGNRFVGFFTFTLNHHLHGLNVTGYHAVNLLIHIINAILIYSLVMITFKTPKLETSALREKSGYIALFSGLLFASHPLQTQAVTYIVQRFASLATLFYLLSLVMYIKARQTTEEVGDKEQETGVFSGKHLFFYSLSVVSAVLAMKTKEIAFTLPIMISLYEFFFFKGKIRRRILYLTPLLLTMFIIPLTLLDISKPVGAVIGDVSEKTMLPTLLSREEYLLTEFRVIVTYLRLLFLPINQHVDYHYPVSSSFFSADVFLSFVFLLIIAGSGIYIFWRFRNTAPDTRLITFGVFWFFITLSVESSIIPITDVIFEHRVYLPSAWFFIAICTISFMISYKIQNRKKGFEIFHVCVLSIVVLVLATATFARNKVWENELTLWENVTRKSPDNARGHYNLGTAYKGEGRIQDAVKQYEITIGLDPEYAAAYNNLGNIYRDKGHLDKAIELYRAAIISYPQYSKAYNNLGAAYGLKDSLQKAEEYYLIALKYDPDFAEAYNNLGSIYKSRGQLNDAIIYFKRAIELHPSFTKAYNNLGNIYKSQGSIDEAIKLYDEAIRLDPLNITAINNIGMAYFDKGNIETAISYFKDAIIIDPTNADAHYNLGIAYGEKGLSGPATSEMRKGMELRRR